MGRAARIAGVTVVILAAVLAVNAVVLDSQTKPAEVNAPGGRILELASVDLQVNAVSDLAVHIEQTPGIGTA